MIIDCHAHFEPRMLDAERVIAKMDAAGVDRIAMIPTMNDPLPHTPEGLLAAMRFLMSDARTRPLAEVVHRITYRGGNLHLSGETFRIYRQPDNDSVVGLVERYPERFLGWIFLNPSADANVLDTLEHYRSHKGMVGIKLHPHWHDYQTDVLWPLLRRAEDLRLPVLIHLGFRSRGDFRTICRAFPKLAVISAHAGFPFYKDLWAYRSECPNLYVDLSSPYIDERLARDAVAAMGPERCLYGTDAPYGFHEEDGSYDYGAIARWVERFPIPSDKRDAIFGATFASLIS